MGKEHFQPLKHQSDHHKRSQRISSTTTHEIQGNAWLKLIHRHTDHNYTFTVCVKNVDTLNASLGKLTTINFS